MRDYGKVHSSFWTSEDTRRLSEDGRQLALYLLTCPHANMIGCFRLPDAYVSEDTQWGSQRVSKGFQNLAENGFATRDPVTKWVVIHRFMKWNPIENPNQGKSAVKLLRAVSGDQAKAAAVVAFRDHAVHVDPWEYESTSDHDNGFETLMKVSQEPFRNQDQEQEQEPDQEQEPKGSPARVKRLKLTETECPPGDALDEAVEAWLARWNIPATAERVWGATVLNFLDRNRAKGLRFKDWSAAWRTSAANAVKWGHADGDPRKCMRSQAADPNAPKPSVTYDTVYGDRPIPPNPRLDAAMARLAAEGFETPPRPDTAAAQGDLLRLVMAEAEPDSIRELKLAMAKPEGA